MAIITYPLNNIEYRAENAEQYLCTRTSGVFSSEENFAIELSSAWVVTIGPGIAWIKNTDFSGKSVVSTESKELDIGLADSTFPKIVRIVIEYDKAKNASDIIILSGTPATSPQAPEITQTEAKYDLCLYEITIPAGASQITMSNVKNTMIDESLCGVMRDGVTAIPTEQLQQSAQNTLNEISESLEAIKDQSDIMLKSVYGGSGIGVVKDSEKLNGYSSVFYAPPGMIVSFAGDSAPNGWLICDGSTVNRKKYPYLFEAIGTKYGKGDGVTTFNLPDCRGKVSVYRDSNDRDFSTVGKTGGEKKHALTRAENGPHNHTLSGGAENASGSASMILRGTGYGSSLDVTEYGSANTSGEGSPHNNLQPYIVFNAIIKY